jgi:hypothetical protein
MSLPTSFTNKPPSGFGERCGRRASRTNACSRNHKELSTSQVSRLITRLKLNEHERVQNAEIGEYPYFCGIRRFVDCRDLVAA